MSLYVLGQEWDCAETGKIIKEAGLPEWPTLAVFLINEASRGTSSRWFPYFATLPKTPSSILQWLVIELPVLLRINLSSRCSHISFKSSRRTYISHPVLSIIVLFLTKPVDGFGSRTEDEVNTWLTASPVREKALECIRDVTET